MADQGFPGQHTTTTVTSSNTTVQTNLRYDPLYIRTIPGMLKIAQIVSNSFDGFLLAKRSRIQLVNVICMLT